MSPPNPTSPPTTTKTKTTSTINSVADPSDKISNNNYSVQNHIKELEISEGQLSSVLK